MKEGAKKSPAKSTAKKSPAKSRAKKTPAKSPALRRIKPGKKLIIVESPAKARTISKFLAGEYEVVASKGHIRDLPKHGFGIKIQGDRFEPQYRINAESKDTVEQLRALAAGAGEVYLATDEDREGEAIAYHIAKAIEREDLPRIVFHEITEGAIRAALAHPRALNMPSVNAQQARRLLDRIVGYTLSPLLGRKIQRGLSAGRVQSAALKLIIDKEREIRAFVPVRYWSVDMIFAEGLGAELVEFAGAKIEKLSLTNQDRARLIFERCGEANYAVEAIEERERQAKPPPPFMTSTLQQGASSALGFSPKKTMMLAQRLYEGVMTPQGEMGVITYMRTDSLNLAEQAVAAARAKIARDLGQAYLPAKPLKYSTKAKGAQEAHEAIRPTNLDFTPELAARYLGGDEARLYALIYNRFLACQMSPSLSQSQSVLVRGDVGPVFKISGRKILFDGYLRVYGEKDRDKILPPLEKGQKMSIEDLALGEHLTEPPARYSEAGLIKKLESLGIGRPSTYAPTISLLTSRDYVLIEARQLVPSELGFSVIELLEKNFAQIVDADFSSRLEGTLDEIAEDRADWQGVLRDFYQPFMRQIEAGMQNIESQKKLTPLAETCPQCGAGLAVRSGRYGDFVACLGFPKCRYSRNLTPEEGGRPAAEGPAKKAEQTGISCPECGIGEIVGRISRRGKFYACNAYPKCTFITNYKPTGDKCGECGGMLVRKDLKRGSFLECLSCKARRELSEE